jgi:hypothetical protein
MPGEIQRLTSDIEDAEAVGARGGQYSSFDGKINSHNDIRAVLTWAKAAYDLVDSLHADYCPECCRESPGLGRHGHAPGCRIGDHQREYEAMNPKMLEVPSGKAG